MPRISFEDLDFRDWMRHAICKGRTDVEWVAQDAQRAAGVPRFDPKPALSICHGGCPVINECLEYALEKNLDGVWGGTIHAERWRIRKARRS